MNLQLVRRAGLARWRLFSVFTALALLVAQAARADGPDEEYLRIFEALEQADSLSEKGQADRARAKYLEAQRQLVEFRQTNPTWNPNLVTHRLKYVSGKLGTAMPKVAAPASTPATATASPGSAAASVSSDIKLISPGAEPRVALRLRPKAGDRQSSTVELSMAMEMAGGMEGMPEMKLPPMKFTMDTEVKEVGADGDISYATEIAAAPLEAAEDESPIGKAMAASMGSFKGMKFEGRISSRGVPKSGDFKLGDKASGMMKGQMDQMQSFMGQTVFPEPQLGAGARWQTERQMKSQGINVTQKETYEITAIAGDVVTLKTTMTQHAANQKMSNPAMPALKMDVAKLESKANSTIVINLGKILPLSADADIQSETVMSMNMGGENQKITSKHGMKMKLESK